jgi:hypothetical protein
MNARNIADHSQDTAPAATTSNAGEPIARSKPAIERYAKLRPGVALPDWSLVSDQPARAALAAIVELIGVGTQKWSPLSSTEDRVWRSVVEQFVALSRTPAIDEIAAATGLSTDTVAEELAKLCARDVVVLDRDGRITGAYPFTERSTGHRVAVRGNTLSAMCAVDALGVGAMLGVDTEIESSCRFCGAPIRAKTGNSGTTIAKLSPEETVVWIGYRYADGCAASSICTVIAFFCSDNHLAAWRAFEKPGFDGISLSVDAALQVGMAIFTPMLRPGRRTARSDRL